MTDELRPRQYVEQALQQDAAQRAAWIAAHVPAEYRAMVEHHVREHAMRVAMLANHVLAGATRDERVRRLERVPTGVREEVRRFAVQEYQQRKQS